MFKKVIKFFDKFEDKNRGALSRMPIVYAIIGGAAHVLFWRGVWHLADDYGLSSFGSLVIGTLVLLATGLIVASFIGDSIILSGIKHEKKVTEKTEEEVAQESSTLASIRKKLESIDASLQEIKSSQSNKSQN